MDPFSIAIIVTVLSAGFLLLYLFKLDFERSQQKHSKSANGTISKKNKQSKSHSTCKQLNKQVPLGESAVINNLVTTKSIENNIKSNPINKLNNKKNNEQVAQKVKLVDTLHKTTIVSSTNHHYDQSPLDELDSSILISVFNPTNQKPAQLKSAKKCNSPQPMQEKKSVHRKRQNSEHSSEQLFNVIATSNLTRDEVELAIESLINKLETGESDWKRPKSDPLQRLKNQLHDNEIALLSEIQNHEQARARVTELKSQLQSERSNSTLVKDELVKLRHELGIVGLALDQTRAELTKQQIFNKQQKDENSQQISKLEKAQLQVLNEAAITDNVEITKLRKEIDDKTGQLQRYELSNQAMGEKLQEYETKLRNVELLLEKAHNSKQQDDYEARAQISDLEADRMRLDKALKDHVARLKEVSETNSLLENSVNELQLINSRLEEMLKRLRDERHVNEASMKRTLCEMEQELKELQTKLSANSASNDEKLRLEMSQVERELSNAGQREQKLMSEMKELREGLAKLLPDYVKASDLKVNPDDWVHQYLCAIKQLAKTVEEFRELNNNDINDSPSKKSVSSRSNGTSSRVGSPTSNGRSSKIVNHESDKKVMETKLLELTDYIAELEKGIQKLKEEKEDPPLINTHEQQIKDLRLQKSKLEAQIKFGLDSLKLEQERVRSLEVQLSNYQPIQQSTSPQQS